MLEIDSKDFGKIKVTEKQRVRFPLGLFGFEDCKEFYIIEYDEIFKCLQSSERKEVAFIIINPYYFKKDYVLDIPDEDLKDLEFGPEEIMKYLDIYVIVTIPSVSPNNITANLLGPLVINTKTQRGLQSLSRNPNDKVKHNILEELEKNSDGEEIK